MTVVYSGIWVKNPEIASWAYKSDMTDAELETAYQDNQNKNRVLVDLDLFCNTSGNLRYCVTHGGCGCRKA